ncbi:MAG: hypothetical protein Kow006_12170 [Gammaproteobacteria bacterium]
MVDLLLRTFAGSAVALTLLFIVNNVLTYWWGWPGTGAFLGQFGWFGFEAPDEPLAGARYLMGALQVLSYPALVLLVAAAVWLTRHRTMQSDAELLTGFAAYIVRAAFWIVVIVGLVDMLISFLRIEDLLSPFLSDQLISDLGRPNYRGHYVHYPLMVLALIIAFFVRSVSFSWLALLVVLAEVQIVLSRFVFSYEQAFMGDLVRFWYAALFLFASAHALVNEAHVRVDVLYVHFSKRGKAWANALGCVLLGMPLCWVILGTGMAGKGSSINSPLLSFEISQSGFGMYVKYLMAGFLVVFAVSMVIQFASYFLNSVAVLRGEPGAADEPGESAPSPH